MLKKFRWENFSGKVSLDKFRREKFVEKNFDGRMLVEKFRRTNFSGQSSMKKFQWINIFFQSINNFKLIIVANPYRPSVHVCKSRDLSILDLSIVSGILSFVFTEMLKLGMFLHLCLSLSLCPSLLLKLKRQYSSLYF